MSTPTGLGLPDRTRIPTPPPFTRPAKPSSNQRGVQHPLLEGSRGTIRYEYKIFSSNIRSADRWGPTELVHAPELPKDSFYGLYCSFDNIGHAFHRLVQGRGATLDVIKTLASYITNTRPKFDQRDYCTKYCTPETLPSFAARFGTFYEHHAMEYNATHYLGQGTSDTTATDHIVLTMPVETIDKGRVTIRVVYNPESRKRGCFSAVVS